MFEHSAPKKLRRRRGVWALSLGASLALSACGGGSGDAASASAAPTASAASRDTVAFSIEAATLTADAAAQIAQPSFHLAPVVLDEPGDADAIDNQASAGAAPGVRSIPADTAALETRGLTIQSLAAAQRAHALAAPRAGDGTVAPLAATSSVTTFTPAQIRAAYSLPVLQSTALAPTAFQAAQQGAGQTIYIVDAMHNPNAAAELAAFNAKFGLPGCTTKAITATAALPLAAASSTEGCTLSVVYSTPAGAMTATAPAYDAGWATEIALDVQWAHATAPRARIVLIEAADASLNGLLGAVKLANAMGAGVVSMSFGGTEGNWTASVDPAFAVNGMTYLAATGDSGSAVSWPAVSPNVLAVGGTSLKYTGVGSRSETSWSRTGGGISAYTAKPAYQSDKVPGVGTLVRRAVADVAFNADPSTGQFVAVMPAGTSTVNWVSAGGTSLSTPQWAGLVAMANALRVQSGKTPIGAPHATLYNQIATVPGTYAAAFGDILTGANGTCSSCAAKVGYDVPTGLGTPNASALLSSLAGAAVVPAAPVVSDASISGKAGVALTFTVSATSSSALTYALTNAPAGMTISAAGVVGWASPVAGTFAVTVTATSASTGTSGKGVLTVVIAKATPPTISAPALTGVAGKALTGSITVSSPSGSGLTINISGVPAGVSFSPNGQTLTLYWTKPVTGKYSLTIIAKDAAGLTTQAVMPITINAK